MMGTHGGGCMKNQKSLLLGMLFVVFVFGYASEGIVVAAEGPGYEVVYPLGRSTMPTKPPAPRLDTLEGKTICELWNDKFHGDKTFPMIEELLAKRYQGIKFVPYAKFGSTHSATEVRDIAALPKKLLESGCNAVISGNGC
jgi:hypothetical protein